MPFLVDVGTSMRSPPSPPGPQVVTSSAPSLPRRRRGGFSQQLAAAHEQVCVLPDFEDWWAAEESQPRTRSTTSSSSNASLPPGLAGEPGIGYRVEPPFRVTEDEIVEIRHCHGLPSWRLESREQRLRPPRWLFVPEKRENPIQRLGTCRCGASEARPEFVRFCLLHLAAAGLLKEGLVYASLGAGELYHDFEVLEGVRAAGGRIVSVLAADAIYKRAVSQAGRNARSALQTLAAWLAADGVPLMAYDDVDALEKANRASLHVLVHSDAPACTGGLPRLQRLLRPGGLYLHMAQGTGSPFEAWRRPGEGSEELELLDTPKGLELVERLTWP